MNKYIRRRVLEDAIISYGERSQTQMCIEECSELIKALCKKIGQKPTRIW